MVHVVESSCQVVVECRLILGFHNKVIDVSFDNAANLGLQSEAHGPLIRRTSVLQSKRHANVT